MQFDSEARSLLDLITKIDLTMCRKTLINGIRIYKTMVIARF